MFPKQCLWNTSFTNCECDKHLNNTYAKRVAHKGYPSCKNGQGTDTSSKVLEITPVHTYLHEKKHLSIPACCNLQQISPELTPVHQKNAFSTFIQHILWMPSLTRA